MGVTAPGALTGRRILVVEDEYFLAADVCDELKRRGAEVIGPAATTADAMALAAQSRIDAAVLDINLRGELVFEVADALAERGVPIVFATGYEATNLPERYANMPRCRKPFEVTELSELLPRVMRPTA